MESIAHSPDPTYLLLIAACAIAALLVLIMKLKVHAFASLTLVSFGTALATGMPSEQVVPTMMSGFGGTLASVALLIVGILVAIPTWYFGAYLFGLYAGNKFNIPLSKAFLNTEVMFKDKTDLPKFSTVLLILLLPVLLIFMDTGLNTLTVAGIIDGKQPVIEFLRMLGKTPIALLITLLVCLSVFAGKYGMGKLEKLCTDALAPICAVILVTGAGGMFGGVLRSSGIGQALADVLADTGMPVILAAFVISTCLRVAQGSATVALTTTAALMAPIVSQTVGLTELDLCFIVIAIAGGATVLSHFNDSGFWLVSRLLEMDEKTTLKTWTVMETLLGTIAFAIVALLSFIL